MTVVLTHLFKLLITHQHRPIREVVAELMSSTAVMSRSWIGDCWAQINNRHYYYHYHSLPELCRHRSVQPSTFHRTVKSVSAFGQRNIKWWRWVWTPAAERQTRGPRQLSWSEGLHALGIVEQASNKQAELLQWLCHDGNTINIVPLLSLFIIKRLTLR